MKHLKDLPNNPGFTFIGVDKDGERHLCIVKIDSIGCCGVYRVEDNEPFFFQLSGWEDKK